ncbi:ABC transporter permease [Rhodophyticola sp. CCM32]|nr:ABC transporter permease [Rhodophyticola sp. CCM32]
MSRPDREITELPSIGSLDISIRRSFLVTLWEMDNTRKLTLLLLLGLFWEAVVVLFSVPDIIIPSASETLAAFVDGVVSGIIPRAVWNSIQTLLLGYAIGLMISAVLVGFAVAYRFSSDFLTTMAAMLNPLPAIALLPLAMIWFGLGDGAIIFTLLHSIVWPVSLYTMTGFRGISPTVRMMGRNYGLKGPRYIALILVPAAFPTILSGLRIGWAFSWRTLMAAELVFGGQVSGGGFSGSATTDAGGLGWFIFRSQMESQTAGVFAGLLAIIFIGVLVENVLFRGVEKATIERWGMTRA